ncbi:MAG: cation-translocating P-type ATPase [Anaerolineae bacterium]
MARDGGKSRGNRRAASTAWWASSAQELAQQLDANLDRGLTDDQVEAHRDRYGDNQIGDRGPTGLWTLAWESVRSPMMLLLLTIAAISFAVGQVREGVVMVFVVAMYVGVHLLNKARSDRTMARLRAVQAPQASVLRDGEVREVPVDDVVAGDILPLQAGTRVAADGLLISSVSLLVDEAVLTGESAPVRKDAGAEIEADTPAAETLAAETPLAERETAVFAGTTVLDGQGQALVVAVGAKSELGRVAALAARAESEPTPLQQEMAGLARTLAVVAVVVSLLIPLLGFLRGYGLQQMVLTWLSLTFLMVPGQPPIIIAMALALAALELARKKVIVRRLQGAETLGAVTVLLSDKTGTMTENRMVLSSVLMPGGEQAPVDGSSTGPSRDVAPFLRFALPALPEHPTDPTDRAMVDAAAQIEGFHALPRGRLVNEIGFSRSHAYRAMAYRKGNARRTFVAGEPELIIDRADRKRTGEGVSDWPSEARARLKAQTEALAGQGKRVTAYGYVDRLLMDGELEDLVFVGTAVIGDPIRPEVEGAVSRLSQAGIRVYMVTGDIPQTASYVAEQVGLGDAPPVTGSELEGAPESTYAEAAGRTRVFARTTPEQKLRLVEALQHQGETVAVTGDGVNDAPALRTAHVGIAMGQRGTDAAREAADLVLTDDSLARLPDGVSVGRKAYDNFRKGITYYLSAKAILLIIFIVPLIVGVRFPLAPIQIIFTELLMDLASSTIFVTEEAEPGLLARRPRRRRRFLSWDVALHIFRNAVGLIVAIMAVYFGSLAAGYGLDSARTAAFATWLLGHILLAMNLKQTTTPLLRQGLLSNRFAAGWLAGMVALVLAMTFAGPVRAALQTTPLTGLQWLGVVGGALLASGWIEGWKWIRLSRRSHE